MRNARTDGTVIMTAMTVPLRATSRIESLDCLLSDN